MVGNKNNRQDKDKIWIKGGIMELGQIKKGDIITYRSERINIVNKPYKYCIWYNPNFTHKTFGSSEDIMKIQRYEKFLCFYRLKTIFERVEKWQY